MHEVAYPKTLKSCPTAKLKTFNGTRANPRCAAANCAASKPKSRRPGGLRVYDVAQIDTRDSPRITTGPSRASAEVLVDTKYATPSPRRRRSA